MLETRRTSTLARLDNVLLVAAVVVGVVVLLHAIGWIVGTLLFLLKVALVVAVITFVARLVWRRTS